MDTRMPPTTAWKYQGTANDFVVLDLRAPGSVPPPAAWVRDACDRHTGVGADGVLSVLPPVNAGSRARMHITNADGTTPEMCGNGLRCVALFLVDMDGGGPRSEAFDVDTDAGVRTCLVERDADGSGQVTLGMGRVRVGAAAGLSPATSWNMDGAPRTCSAVDVGNPHLVLDAAPDMEQAARLGPALVKAPGFPNGTNVEWITRDGDGLRVLVFERGVGITMACGTGAVASAFAAEAWGWLRVTEAGVPVVLPGGTVRVGRAADGQATLSGPARRVFRADLG